MNTVPYHRAIPDRLRERAALLDLALAALGHRDPPPPHAWNSIPADAPWAREMLPLLWYGVVRGALPRPPPPLDRQCLETYLLADEQADAHARLLRALGEATVARGARLCLIKGAALARQVYPAPRLRMMSDLDLLAPPGGAGEADAACRGLGALPDGATPAHTRWRFPAFANTVVEIHVRLRNPASPLQRLFMPARFLDTVPWSETVPSDDGFVALPPDFHRAYLWLHALREGYVALKWFVDDALLGDNPPSVIDRTARHAGRLMAESRQCLNAVAGGDTPRLRAASLPARLAAAGCRGRWSRALLMALATVRLRPG